MLFGRGLTTLYSR